MEHNVIIRILLDISNKLFHIRKKHLSNQFRINIRTILIPQIFSHDKNINCVSYDFFKTE